MYLNVFVGLTRPALQPSTTASVTYRTAAWFLCVSALLLAPAALGSFAYSFWLYPRLSGPIFPAEHASSLPFALTILSAHTIILWFLYGVSAMSNAIIKCSHDAACLFMHQFIGLDVVIAALNQQHRYHRSHISHMRSDRFTRIMQLKCFTVFILGAKQQSVPVRMCHPFDIYLPSYLCDTF